MATKKHPKKICIIGCGNVAWHMAKHLSKNKSIDLLIANHRKNNKLEEFENKLGTNTQYSLNNLPSDIDAFLICVNDSSISSVLNSISKQRINVPVLITSATFDLKKHEGLLTSIFYPLQTFSRDAKIHWKNIPIVIDFEKKNLSGKIDLFAKLFSKHIIHLKYNQRLLLHLSAVFANNFSNALFLISEQLLKKADKKLSLKILGPLLEQTVSKAIEMSPLNAQTGPAKRKDVNVQKKHLALLKNDKNLIAIYRQMSKLIVAQQD